MIPRTVTRTNNKVVYIIGMFSAIGGLLFGYDIGVISGILTMNNFKQTFPTTPFKQGSIVSSLLAGCFAGALASSYFAEKIGRRFSILGASVLFIIGALLQTTANEFVQLYFGRVVAGISVGILSMIVPLYQAEVSPREIRGRLVSIQQFAITIGIAISFWVDYGTSFINADAQWRIPLAIQVLPAVILGLSTIYLPFSPRWLMNKDRNEEAVDVLAKLRSKGDRTAWIVENEFNEIKANILVEREYGLKSYAELLKRGPENVRRRMFLGIFIQIFQQLTGINAVMYYAPSIFQDMGLKKTSSSLLATGINGFVNVIATIPAILFVDRWGRRPTLIFGGIFMSISMLIVGILSVIFGSRYYDTSNHKNMVQIHNDSASYSIITFMYVFVASFAFSWGPVGWIYPAEIYPLRIRGKAMSVTTACNWLFNFGVGQITPILLDRITYGTYFIFAGFCLIMAATIYIFFPETNGKSLEEMDELFGPPTVTHEVEQAFTPPQHDQGEGGIGSEFSVVTRTTSSSYNTSSSSGSDTEIPHKREAALSEIIEIEEETQSQEGDNDKHARLHYRQGGMSSLEEIRYLEEKEKL